MADVHRPNMSRTQNKHPYCFHIPLVRKKFQSDSYFPRTIVFCNRLRRRCFPDHCHLNLCKSRVKSQLPAYHHMHFFQKQKYSLTSYLVCLILYWLNSSKRNKKNRKTMVHHLKQTLNHAYSYFVFHYC